MLSLLLTLLIGVGLGSACVPWRQGPGALVYNYNIRETPPASASVRNSPPQAQQVAAAPPEPDPSPLPGVTLGRYRGRNCPRVVADDSELHCNFQGRCAYENAAEEEDDMDWGLANGRVPPILFRNFMGHDEQAHGGYLVTGTFGEKDPFVEAHLHSCPLPCTDGPVAVSLRHWATTGAQIEICLAKSRRDDGLGLEREMSDCALLPDSQKDPGPSTVNLPPIPKQEDPNIFYQFVIIGHSFDGPSGGLVVIDDILVKFDVCKPPTTTTTTTTTMTTTTSTTPKVATTTTIPTIGQPVLPTTTTKAVDIHTHPVPHTHTHHLPTTTTTTATILPPSAATECAAIDCNFEKGNCAYVSVGSSRELFELVEGRFRNPISGIRKPAHGGGRYYAAVAVYEDEEAWLSAAIPGGLSQPRELHFRFYEAAQGLELRACCGSPDDCPFSSNVDVVASKWEWGAARLMCPTGTKRVLFQCRNEGAFLGSCGVDEIRLFHRGEPLCPEAKGG